MTMVINGEAESVGPSLMPQPRKNWTSFDKDEGINQSSVETDSSDQTVATLEPSQTLQINREKDSPSRIIGEKGSFSESKLSLSPSSSSITTTSNRVNNNLKQIALNIEDLPSNKYSNSSSIPDLPSTSSPSADNVNSNTNESQLSSEMQTIPLKQMSRSPSKSFNNGDVIVSLMPLNNHCAWLTPATFKPELVPEELMASSLQLTVEDYVGAMQTLVNDYRFNLYIIFYKRVMVVWVVLGFIILLSLLFSGARGLPLFAGGIVWLIVNAFGVFFSMWIKCKLMRMLERCIARVNEIFYKNNILLGVDDKGKISCHKINLVFVFFDSTYCIKYLNDLIANEERSRETSNQITMPNLNHLRSDIDATDIIVTGSTPTKYSQREKFGEKLLLRYSQRWIRDHNRSRATLTVPLYPDGTDFTPISPRHCATSRCPCQYIEEHLKFKPLTKCSLKELFC